MSTRGACPSPNAQRPNAPVCSRRCHGQRGYRPLLQRHFVQAVRRNPELGIDERR